MFTNKTKNSTNAHLNTNLITSNYSRPRISLPIKIPGSINKLNSLYIYDPLRNENRFININLNSSYNNSIESDDNPIYATIESPPQKVGSSTFYIDTESMDTDIETSKAATPMPTENNDEENIYETVDLPPPLPPRNRLRSFDEFDDEIQFDNNPFYSSFDEKDIPPEVPPKRSDLFLEDNPWYQTIEQSIPYLREKLRDHTLFRKKYCKV